MGISFVTSIIGMILVISVTVRFLAREWKAIITFLENMF